MKSTIITIGVVALIIIAGIAIYTSAEKECCDDEKNVSMEFPTVLKLSLGDGLKCTYQGKEHLNGDSIVLLHHFHIECRRNDHRQRMVGRS